MFKKVLHTIFGVPMHTSKTLLQPSIDSQVKSAQRHLINQEALIGATLFGEIPAGHTRQFFCLDEHTWVWFEEWFDEKLGIMQHMNVHYELQPRGVLKLVNGTPRGYVNGQELQHLLRAIQDYHNRVSKELYSYAAA